MSEIGAVLHCNTDDHNITSHSSRVNGHVGFCLTLARQRAPTYRGPRKCALLTFADRGSRAGTARPRTAALLPALPRRRGARLRYTPHLGANIRLATAAGRSIISMSRLARLTRLDTSHLAQQHRSRPGRRVKVSCLSDALEADSLVVVHTNLKIRVSRHQAASLPVVVSQDTTRSYGGGSYCAVLRCNTLRTDAPRTAVGKVEGASRALVRGSSLLIHVRSQPRLHRFCALDTAR
jgi:hypothetical protein